MENELNDKCMQDKLKACHECVGNRIDYNRDGKKIILPGVYVCADDNCDYCKCLDCKENEVKI